MLKRLATVVVFLFVLASFSNRLFAQDDGIRTFLRCVYCHKDKDKSEIVIVPQELIGMREPIRQLYICTECNKLPKCNVCGMPTEEKVLPDSDDFRLCKMCQSFQPKIPEPAETQKLSDDICRTFASKFKMPLKSKVKAELDTQYNIARLGKQADATGLYYGYNNNKQHRIILSNDVEMTLYSLLTIASHEIAHAWYFENGFDADGEDRIIAEGFAQFVAWRYMMELKNGLPKDDTSLRGTLMDDEMRRIETKDDVIYGDGFRIVREMFGNAKTAPEWKTILQREFKKGTWLDSLTDAQKEEILGSACVCCRKPGGHKIAGGGVLCDDCYRISVKNIGDAEKAIKDVRRTLTSKYRMTFKRSLSFEYATWKSAGFGENEKPDELGLYEVRTDHKKKTQYVIRVLTVRPRDEFDWTCAHELAHAWMDENLPHLMDKPEIKEGFAEYVAWTVSNAEGAKRMAERTEKRTDSVYGDGFRTMRQLLNNAPTAAEWKTILLREYPAPAAKQTRR